MDFSEFPAQWDWVALILGGVAFLMAIQPFIQMLCGRPKIVIEFGVDEREDEIYFVCKIYNRPITSKFLNWLGIYRNNADICAFYEIEDSNSHQSLFRNNAAVIKTQANTLVEHASIPASVLPDTFSIAEIKKPNKYALIRNGEYTLILPNGRFIVKVKIIHGVKEYKKQGHLVAQDKHPFFYWDTA